MFSSMLRRLACLFIFLIGTYALAQTLPVDQDAPRFRHMGVEAGLSQSRVLSLHHAKDGFLWVGTQDGLNRYDGYTFKVFRHNGSDPTSISDNQIFALDEDVKGRVLVATTHGVDRYDPKTGGFIHLYKDIKARALLPMDDGSLWIGSHHGLYKLNDQDQVVQQYHLTRGDGTSLKVFSLVKGNGDAVMVGTQEGLFLYENDQMEPIPLFPTPEDETAVNALVNDGGGGLWVGTRKGLFHVLPHQPPIAYHDEREQGNLRDPFIQALHLDRSGRLWIGTDSAGVAVFYGREQGFRHFTETGKPNALKGKGVWSFASDPRGGLWLGTFGEGLCRLEEDELPFDIATHNPEDPTSLTNNHILTIFKDQQGTLWVGTDRGLNRADQGSSAFRRNYHDPKDANGLTGNAVTSITQDNRQRIWLGVWNGGLHRWWPDDKGFDHFWHDPNNPQSISSDTVISLLPTESDTLWVGTSKGLDRIDVATDHLRHIQSDVMGKPSIFALWAQNEQTLWVGTRDGLFRLDVGSGQVRGFDQGSDEQKPAHKTILAFHGDQRLPHILWVATAQGLSKLDLRTETFTSYRTDEGLPNDTIYGVLEDDRGRLWISTSKGLAVADKDFENCRIFDHRDGLPGSEFNAGAFYRDPSGRFYFGSHEGLLSFLPHPWEGSSESVPVYFTDFLLNNMSVKPQSLDPQSPLPASVASVEHMTLNHHHSMVGFAFSALDYTAPWHVRYRYRMDGFDREWIETERENRRATYTNLPAGTYTFEVQAATSTGSWDNNVARIDLTVLAPPWLTWWAKTFYVLVFFTLLGIYIYLQRQKLAHERKIARQQRQLAEKDRATAQRLMELDKLKDQFLANTSHELRTPINGIIGLADGMLAYKNGRLPLHFRTDLSMIVHSGRRLSSLINDILDFSSLNKGTLNLNKGPVDVHVLAATVLTLNRTTIGEKKLTLHNEVPSSLPPVYADEARLGQILHNLVGNAVKFTEVGHVWLRAHIIDDSKIEISVEDTGIGMSREAQQGIFSSFQQADGGIARGYSGTGLGLAITQRILDLHGSTVSMRSEEGEGSSFWFQVEISNEPLPANSELLVSRPTTLPDLAESEDGSSQEPDTNHLSDVHILAVDDELVNRRVLTNHLRPQGYQVSEAVSGFQCLEMVAENRPDMILLDIMMPELSGYEVCKKLREQYSVEELPIIFLTARNRVDDMLEAFSVGANDFLAKPVSRQELLARVRTHLQLLEINRHLEQKIQEGTKALITSQKIAGVGTLAKGLAHEINNPNNLVDGGAQVLEDMLEELKEEQGRGALLPECQEWENVFSDLFAQVRMVRDGSRRISQVVAQMRQYTTASTSKKQKVNITDTLANMVPLVQAQYKDVTFSFDETHAHYYDCVPGELGQTFLNLLINSCEAIEACQKKQADAPEGVVSLRVYHTPKLLYCTVSDNGCGMDEEMQSRVFEPFFTTKRGGTTAGLGLYTAWEVVSNLKGHIDIESTPGQGTCVRIALPIGPPSEKEPDAL